MDKKMLAGLEIVVVAVVVVAIFFFGRGKVIEWAKTVGDAKKAFDDAASGKEEKKE